MSNELIKSDNEINNIFDNIKDLVINSRNKVYQTVNTEMLNLYWNIGKAIMEIQQGDERASYGDAVLDKLSQKLTNEFGKGFSSRNLRTMRKFYLMYPIWKTVSAKLSWSHYLELIKINETVVKYTLPEDNKTIFSSEYKLHMPTEQELITAVEEEMKNFELKEKN